MQYYNTTNRDAFVCMHFITSPEDPVSHAHACLMVCSSETLCLVALSHPLAAAPCTVPHGYTEAPLADLSPDCPASISSLTWFRLHCISTQS